MPNAAGRSVPAAFREAMRTIYGVLPPRKLALSVSGGVDSMAMASMTSRWAKSSGIDIHALVVDHGLRDESAVEASVVQENLDKLGINSSVLKLNMDRSPQSTIEARARTARRHVLIEKCHALGFPDIAFGHTEDDQIELFLIRLMTQSGWYGLGGMHQKTFLETSVPPFTSPIQLIRPVLGFRKHQLRAWCTDNKVDWVEDETNQDPTLTQRNSIRKILELYDDVLPNSHKVEAIAKAYQYYYRIREETVGAAAEAFQALRNSEAITLYATTGTAAIALTPDFEALPVRVRSQIMFELMRYVSPLAPSQLFNRRERIARFVSAGYQAQDSKVGTRSSLMDVLTTRTTSGSMDTIRLSRSVPKRAEKLQYDVYPVSYDWSRWHLLDERFWCRWRLPPTNSALDAPARNLAVYKGAPLDAVSLLKKLFKLQSLPNQHTLQTQPFFTWDDPDSTFDINSQRVVGMPTLGLLQGVEIECRHQGFLWHP